jgi:hypothetical protein
MCISTTSGCSAAAQAKGYLALLRAFVRELEGPDARVDTLRGLVAPESAAADFSVLYQEAEQQERRCRGA